MQRILHFYATLSANVVLQKKIQTIIYDNAKINEGGHYDTTTGKYTAPVAGIYQFFAYIKVNPTANFYFFVDGTKYANAIEAYDKGESDRHHAEGL